MPVDPRRTVDRAQRDGAAAGAGDEGAEDEGPPRSNAMPIGCLGFLLLDAIVLHLLGRC